MNARAVLRALTPLGWGAAVLVMVVVSVALARGVGVRWDPFNRIERRLEAAESRAVTAEQDVAARRLEVEAGEAQARRADTHHQTRVAIAEMTTRTLEQAGQADDAGKFLDEERADRLRAHDRRLCELAPAVCAAAQAASAG